MPEEIVLIDKPKGLTSADVVNLLKPAFGQKIGHAGTLDPLASGLLIILVGKATKLFSHFQSLAKTYTADILFGQTTTTLDLEGAVSQQITPDQAASLVKLDKLKSVLRNFPRKYVQQIPAYSAAKYKGKPLYWWVRQKKQVENIPIKTKSVDIYDLKLTKFYQDKKGYPHARITISVSSGFYVRQFAWDLGQKLQVPAFLFDLRRTAIGDFRLE
ncbi:MAG: tRNA pseudouridine(55) synthase TruB [bacterium]|nr:tRNA pseudouridine(55) synthase TruB [bacterium]